MLSYSVCFALSIFHPLPVPNLATIALLEHVDITDVYGGTDIRLSNGNVAGHGTLELVLFAVLDSLELAIINLDFTLSSSIYSCFIDIGTSSNIQLVSIFEMLARLL